MNEPRLSAQEELQLAVSRALACWQFIENTLQWLFTESIASPDMRWSSAAYNSVISLGGKLNMLQEILRYRLPTKQLVTEWNKLREQIDKKSRKRNHLAHWSFVAEPDNSTGQYVHTLKPAGDGRRAR